MPEQTLQFLPPLSSAHYSFISNAADEHAIGVFQSVVQGLAISLSALAGVYAARKHGMDHFGLMVIASVSCVGGGTIRDLLLGRFPVFWLESPVYVIAIGVISLFGLFIQRGAEQRRRVIREIAEPVDRLDRPLLLRSFAR